MTAAFSLARREVVRFLRQPSRVVGAVVPPLLMWLLVGSGLSATFSLRSASGGRSGTYVYFFPGTVVLVVLFAAIFATISVIEDRREGFLQGVLVSPVSGLEIALGKVLGGAALGLLQGGTLLVLVPFLGLAGRPLDLALALVVLAVVAVALTGLGFAIAWSLESTQGFHAVMNLFLIPMWLLSGAFFPLDGAPAWLRAAMALDPMTYGVAALRRGLDPAPPADLPGLGLSLAVSAAFAAAMLALSAAVVVRRPAGPARTSSRKARR